MMVNHMFFSCFPFQDRPVSLQDEFYALCGVYAMLRFLGIAHIHENEKIEGFVDVAAAVFRLIDHKEFDRYAAYMLKKVGCNNWDRVRDLLSL